MSQLMSQKEWREEAACLIANIGDLIDAYSFNVAVQLMGDEEGYDEFLHDAVADRLVQELRSFLQQAPRQLRASQLTYGHVAGAFGLDPWPDEGC